MAHDTEHNQPSGAAKMFGDFAPALVHFTDDVLFGQVWKQRSLVTVAMSAMAVAKQVFGNN
jgi:4-carboxymuconolactone decarboxylase